MLSAIIAALLAMNKILKSRFESAVDLRGCWIAFK
jgi:hypothetical protein